MNFGRLKGLITKEKGFSLMRKNIPWNIPPRVPLSWQTRSTERATGRMGGLSALLSMD